MLHADTTYIPQTAGKELETAEMVVNKEQKATHRIKTLS